MPDPTLDMEGSSQEEAQTPLTNTFLAKILLLVFVGGLFFLDFLFKVITAGLEKESKETLKSLVSSLFKNQSSLH